MTNMGKVYAQRAERLRRYRIDKLQERSMAAMARKAGLADSTYKALEYGTRPIDEEWAVKLRNKLGIPTDFLLHGNDTEHEYLNSPVVSRSVPILSWDEFGDKDMAISIEQLSKNVEKIAVPPFAALGNNTFALRFSDESMNPDHRAGGYGIFNPDLEWSPDDFVLARVDAIQKAIVRRCRWVGVDDKSRKTIDLVPANPSFPTFSITDGHNGLVIAKLIMYVAVYA
jgi:SOS-response transcriptional repressor LexA